MDDKQAIRDLVDLWMTATKRGDTATVLGLMTDDVVFLAPGHDPFGKSEFAKASAEMRDLKIDGTSDIQEIEVAGAWAWCRTALKLAVTTPDGKVHRRSGYTLTILRKTNGKWQLARDANLLTADS